MPFATSSSRHMMLQGHAYQRREVQLQYCILCWRNLGKMQPYCIAFVIRHDNVPDVPLAPPPSLAGNTLTR